MKIILRKKQKGKGFSLIEIIISMAIFVIILSLATVNHRQGEYMNTFRLQTFNVEDSIRSIQNMSLTGKKIAGLIPDAYGIFFSETGNNIIVYGDFDGNNLFNDSIDKIYSEVSLDGGVGFNKYTLFCDELVSSDSLNIVFVPPKPTMIINNNLNNNSTCSSSIIFMESDNTAGTWEVYFDNVTGRTWTEFSE